MGRNVENRRVWQRLYRVKHKQRINAEQRRRYALKEKTKTPEQKEAHRLRERTRYKTQTKEYHAIRTKRYRVKLKTQVIFAYGGKCTCPGCDISHPDFLTVDHVNNDGNEHRKTLRGTFALYRHIRDAGYPKRFTVLCFNCNIARSLFDTCPHVRRELYP